MMGIDETDNFLILRFIAFERRMSPKALILINCVVDHLLCNRGCTDKSGTILFSFDCYEIWGNQSIAILMVSSK
jgi:hypothetical protein